MKRLFLLIRDFGVKRRFLLALALVFLLVVVGVGYSYNSLVSAKLAQPQDLQDAEADHESLRSQPLSSTGSCGVERWAVKTGTDADIGLVNLQSITPTTIATLTALSAPGTLPANNRIQPTETTVYQVQGTLTQYKLESDSDYHLILSDTSGKTMIVEIPDPACVGSSSPLMSDIQKARTAFDARYNVTSSFQTANVPVTVTGVGFFDFLHGQTGVAPNGIELHAILDIQFGSGSGGTPTPTPTHTPSTTPTPSPTGTPTGSNLIQNGGFEASGNWTYSGSPNPVRSTTQKHSGSYSLRVGATSGQQGDSIAYQIVTIPSTSTSASLSFYYWPTTNDSSTYAWQEVDVINSSGQVVQQLFKKTANDRAWVQATFNLSSYAGQTIGIRFLDHENSNSQSYYGYMYVDDVFLTAN
ncbi:hypothetical protein KSC_012970 [Ktedonobacter sp. SOSP1-52]|uniref:hypothetical protein n=1 Tax=Ktedonobacter sp. SOSP1-52 TaxID=2778366 RepID=UPI001915E3C2|nr:hypothetical protein [Ktedonobacter sp. SOSP1-52]GHO62405.1 hypothetical protein KSC_012970 [Ktedonobacter sp. SOSP1-52]